MTMRTAVIALSVLALVGTAKDRPAAAADPGANRKASAAYDAGLRNNPAFRGNREQLECDPIDSLDLRAQCLASFDAAPAPVGPAPSNAADDPSAAADFLHPKITVTNGPV